MIVPVRVTAELVVKLPKDPVTVPVTSRPDTEAAPVICREVPVIVAKAPSMAVTVPVVKLEFKFVREVVWDVINAS